MATDLSEFLPYVLPSVPACPDTLAEQAVLSACIEFCRTTMLVQELTTDTLVKDTADYTVEVPVGQTLIKVLGVWVGDKRLSPTTIETVRSGLALRGSTAKEQVSNNAPQVYFQKTPTSQEISVYPVPAEPYSDGLAIRAAFAPSRTATAVADVLFDSWTEEIAWGALARLHSIPEQSFYSLQLSELHKQKFSSALRKASNIARSGQIVAASRLQPIEFSF